MRGDSIQRPLRSLNQSTPGRWLNFLIWIMGASLLLAATSARASESLKVGVFQNRPIVFYENGFQGIFVEILDHVAEKEGWQLEYVPCELNQCIELLRANQLDLMTSLGESTDRLEYLDFSSEPVWTFWGTIVSQDLAIQSVFDLRYKKIGVRKKNKTTAALQKMLSEFVIPVQYVEFDNYELAFQALTDDELDAVAVNNAYSFQSHKKSNFHVTPIVFNAFSAYFAAPKIGYHRDVLETIDTYVKSLKSDPYSLYYVFEKKWFGIGVASFDLKKLAAAAGVLLALVISGMAFWRYRSQLSMHQELIGILEVSRQTARELKESEARFRLIADSMPQLIWTAGPDGIIDYRNKRFQELVPGGGKNIDPADKEKTYTAWFNAVSTGQDYRMEHRLAHTDGSFHWYFSLGIPVRDEKGDIVRWYGSSTDIDELRQTREKLDKNELLLRQTQEISETGGWEYDVESTHMIWTPETYRIHEVEMTFDPNAIPTNISFYDEEARDQIKMAFDNAVENGRPYDLVLPFVTAKGRHRWVRTLARVETRDGQVRRVYGMIMDITELKQREEKIRQINEDLLTINRIILATTSTSSGVKGFLEKVLDEALVLSGLEGGMICMSGSEDRLLLTVQRKMSQQTIADFNEHEMKIGSFLCGECVRNHKPMVLANRAEIQAHASPEVQQDVTVHYHASFPLLVGPRCLGVLCIFTRSEKTMSRRTLHLLESVSSQIAIAVENARLFEEISRHTVTLEERVLARTADLEESQRAMQLLLEDMEEAQEKLKGLNKQFVGRELRMRELKTENALLKTQEGRVVTGHDSGAENGEKNAGAE